MLKIRYFHVALMFRMEQATLDYISSSAGRGRDLARSGAPGEALTRDHDGTNS